MCLNHLNCGAQICPVSFGRHKHIVEFEIDGEKEIIPISDIIAKAVKDANTK